MLDNQRPQLARAAGEHYAYPAVPQGADGAGDDLGRPVITAHRVHRDDCLRRTVTVPGALVAEGIRRARGQGVTIGVAAVTSARGEGRNRMTVCRMRTSLSLPDSPWPPAPEPPRLAAAGRYPACAVIPRGGQGSLSRALAGMTTQATIGIL